MTDASPAILPLTLRRTRVGVSLAYAVQGFNTALLAVAVPGMVARNPNLGPTEIALLTLSIGLAGAVGSVLAGALAKRTGSGSLIVPGLLLQAGMLALIILNLPVLVYVPIYLVYGLGVGLAGAGNGMQAITVQRGYGTSIVTLFFAFQSGAIIVAALTMSAVTGVGLPFEYALVFAVILGIVVCFLLRGRFARDLEAGPNGDRVLRSQRGRLPWAGLMIFGFVVAAALVGDTAVLSWSSVYVGTTLESAAFLAPLGFAGYQATTLIVRLLGDLVVRRIGRVKVMTAAVLISTTCFVGIAFASSPLIAVLLFMALGFGLGVIVPLSFSAAGDLDRDRADEIIARLNLFSYAGSIIGAVAVGLIAEASSLGFAYLLPAILIFPTLAALGAYRQRVRVSPALRPTPTVAEEVT